MKRIGLLFAVVALGVSSGEARAWKAIYSTAAEGRCHIQCEDGTIFTVIVADKDECWDIAIGEGNEICADNGGMALADYTETLVVIQDKARPARD